MNISGGVAPVEHPSNLFNCKVLLAYPNKITERLDTNNLNNHLLIRNQGSEDNHIIGKNKPEDGQNIKEYLDQDIKNPKFWLRISSKLCIYTSEKSLVGNYFS